MTCDPSLLLDISYSTIVSVIIRSRRQILFPLRFRWPLHDKTQQRCPSKGPSPGKIESDLGCIPLVSCALKLVAYLPLVFINGRMIQMLLFLSMQFLWYSALKARGTASIRRKVGRSPSLACYTNISLLTNRELEEWRSLTWTAVSNYNNGCLRSFLENCEEFAKLG